MELLNFTPVPTRARHDGWSAADSANFERIDSAPSLRTFANIRLRLGGLRAARSRLG